MTIRFLSGVNEDGFVFGADDSLLEPIPVPAKPVVAVPRSTKREYSAEEMQCAARMMDRLRRGDDRRTLAERNPDAVLDVVVDRMLRVMG